MQSGNNNRLTVDTAAARDKMNAMKYEIANEIGVDLKKEAILKELGM